MKLNMVHFLWIRVKLILGHGMILLGHGKIIRGLVMWKYEKKLQYPVNIKNKDLNMAKCILTQYGGPAGDVFVIV